MYLCLAQSLLQIKECKIFCVMKGAEMKIKLQEWPPAKWPDEEPGHESQPSIPPTPNEIPQPPQEIPEPPKEL